MATTSPGLADAGPAEILLVKIARVVIYVVLGYLIGLGTEKPLMNLLRSCGKLPEHAVVQTNTLTQKPTVEMQTGVAPHPPAKATK
jgi:hypothetical protein